MNDLYELKVSVEGLTQTLRDLNRLDATMEKLGGKTPGLDQFESRMAVAMRDMTQAANQMVIASSRMSSPSSGMVFILIFIAIASFRSCKLRERLLDFIIVK